MASVPATDPDEAWPREPAPTGWRFPPARSAGGEDLVAVGADLEPGTVLAAYRAGLFPMPVDQAGPIGWWSPVRRGVLPLDRLRVTRSLRQSGKRYRITVDADFDGVIGACAGLPRPGGWIRDDLVDAYRLLHRLGWAHSIETWDADGGLAGGLYGLALGGMFAGESMFHVGRDASKVALVALVDVLAQAPGDLDGRLVDVQWATPHLSSLGVVEISRGDYLARLARALALPPPPGFG